MRHSISRLYEDFEQELVSAREVGSDIGRKAPQGRYADVGEIIKANFKRVQESLRVLEEYSRLCGPADIKKVKRLRFLAYSLEKSFYEKH